ncbi:AI-2E family transporter [Methylocapsa acidiphila]|uniref:AI-2E family transporter n=1 Tax=Methylocapsa acidiphila TaxID=133552 RepID=UPI0012EB7429|nr:AI-2E family transporter [Methylocapsa acidiphila]
MKPPPRTLVFWIATLVIVFAAVVLLREILLPFVAAIALAYLLSPVVDHLERLGLNRAVATLAIIGLFFGSVITAILFLTPVLGAEIALFIDKFPAYVAQLQAFAEDPSRPWLRKIVGEGLTEAEQATGQIAQLGAGWVTSILGSLWSGGQALISIFSLLVVAPIIAFYLIQDWQGILATLDRAVPAAYREEVRHLAGEINGTIEAFLRGQGTICLVLAIYYALALWLIGLNHGLLIGLAAGFVSFVPYLGLLTGLVLSVVVAILQFWPSWSAIPVVVGVFVVGQAVADYALSPYLVGARIKLDPVSVIFAISAFGYLFGFVGLLIAVPLAAAIGVVLRFAVAHYSTGPEAELGVAARMAHGGVAAKALVQGPADPKSR